MTRERRAHARVAVPLDARVRVGERELILQVREISRSGIFLYTKDPLGRLGKLDPLVFARYLITRVTRQPFHTNINWTAGPKAGQEVEYLELQGRPWLTDAGLRERLRVSARARRGTLTAWKLTSRQLADVLGALAG